MHREFILVSCLLALSPAWAADAPSVAVQTVAIKQQMMTDTIAGYGVVSPDTRSLRNISLPRAGQVVSLQVNAGQVVKKGTPLLQFATGKDAALSFQQAAVAAQFAAGEVRRIEQLVSQQLATQSQLATAKKSLADAQAAMRAQQQMGNGRSIEQVVAPFDGVVVSISTAPGDRLAAGAALLQLAQAGAQRVVVGVEPEDVVRVRPGMAVRVASVFNEAHQVPGQVQQVFGMINPQTQFVDVLVEIPNGGLIAGTRVTASIQLGRQPAWVVPRAAVLRDVQGAYLFQVQAGKARRINVQTGLEQGAEVAVSGRFNPHQRVVSTGNYELQNGTAVRESGP